MEPIKLFCMCFEILSTGDLKILSATTECIVGFSIEVCRLSDSSILGITRKR